MSDLGDLDGDDTFDAIDLAIMGNGGDNEARNGNDGCCVVLLLGSLFAAGLVVVDYFA